MFDKVYMMYIYVILAIIFLGYMFLIEYSKERFSLIDESIYFRIPFLFNIPTRNFPIYQDIRGEPNLIYRKSQFGVMMPYAYRFGPYIYDAQGNYFQYLDDTEFIV